MLIADCMANLIPALIALEASIEATNMAGGKVTSIEDIIKVKVSMVSVEVLGDA